MNPLSPRAKQCDGRASSSCRSDRRGSDVDVLPISHFASSYYSFCNFTLLTGAAHSGTENYHPIAAADPVLVDIDMSVDGVFAPRRAAGGE